MINGAREDIRWVENCWIPTPDGIRLAATIWLPRNAEISPVPAVLEIVPYRKRDHTAVRDEQLHSGLARSGFAGIRVDMRGSGDSEGVFDAHRTYDDVLHILAWIRSQAWCTGDLGMIGLSWGGLNAIMAAERQPPGLGAVVACSFSHDRYGVGMMWKNGCLLSENFAWATSVTSFCSRPPDPAVVGAGWREMWLDRLSNLEPQVQHYLGHQRRDDYWDMHRVTDLGRISCPVYAFAGWADSNYTQTLPALLTNASGPVKAVIGPWGHKYPYQAVPGPGIDFVAEATSWFAHWLRGEQNGAESAPKLRAFILHDLPAKPDYPVAPGRWIAESSWPLPDSGSADYYLRRGALDSSPPEEHAITFRSPQTVGLASGEVMPWFAYGPGPELPGDQREDDGKSLCFDSPPLDRDLDSLGAPTLDLEFAVDRPASFLAVRLCDVKPDGSSTRINLGLHHLNRHWNDREPMPLEPGIRYCLNLPLDFKGYLFRRGHRIRLALSTTYWPMVWPSPEPVTLTVFAGRSRIGIPLRQPDSDRELEPAFDPPRAGLSPARTQVEPVRRSRIVHHDLVTDQTVMTISEDNGAYRLDDLDWEVSSQNEKTFRIRNDDPVTAEAEVSWSWKYRRADWETRTHTSSRLSCETGRLFCTVAVKAHEGPELVFEREWIFEFPRDLL